MSKKSESSTGFAAWIPESVLDGAAAEEQEETPTEDPVSGTTELAKVAPSEGAIVSADDEIESFESELVDSQTTLPAVSFSITKDELVKRGTDYTGITFDTPTNYERGRLAIADMRSIRVAVGKRQKQLNDGANTYKKWVKAEAEELLHAIDGIETPLLAAKKVVDDEKERVRLEKEAAKQAELEEKLRAERAQEEARLKAIRDAEQAELDRQRAELVEAQAKLDAETARLAEEKRKADEARAEADRKAQADRDAADAKAKEEREAAAKVERDAKEAADKVAREAREAEERKLAADRAALEAEKLALRVEKERADRVEFERQAKVKAEAEAAEKLARDQAAAEEARLAELARQEVERARLEALKPDVERLRAFAADVRALKHPELRSVEATNVLAAAVIALGRVAADIEAFGAPASGAQAAE